MREKIIGVKELRATLPAIAKAAGRGERFLVMRHHLPLFRIEPVEAEPAPKPMRGTLAEAFRHLQFRGGDPDASKKIDEIVYGV